VDRLLAVPVEDTDDAVVVFEVDERMLDQDLDFAAADHGAVVRARTTLDQALRAVRPALRTVVNTVRELSSDEVEVEFGLKVGGESGVIIAKGTSEVNFAVRLTWRRA
jgi:hypothetical protein